MDLLMRKHIPSEEYCSRATIRQTVALRFQPVRCDIDFIYIFTTIFLFPI